MSKDVIHGVTVERNCRQCDGTGLIGYFYCGNCRTTLSEIKPTGRCAHPPHHLNDNRAICSTCLGSGRVIENAPAGDVVAYLWTQIELCLNAYFYAREQKGR